MAFRAVRGFICQVLIRTGRRMPHRRRYRWEALWRRCPHRSEGQRLIAMDTDAATCVAPARRSRNVDAWGRIDQHAEQRKCKGKTMSYIRALSCAVMLLCATTAMAETKKPSPAAAPPSPEPVVSVTPAGPAIDPSAWVPDAQLADRSWQMSEGCRVTWHFVGYESEWHGYSDRHG